MTDEINELKTLEDSRNTHLNTKIDTLESKMNQILRILRSQTSFRAPKASTSSAPSEIESRLRALQTGMVTHGGQLVEIVWLCNTLDKDVQVNNQLLRSIIGFCRDELHVQNDSLSISCYQTYEQGFMNNMCLVSEFRPSDKQKKNAQQSITKFLKRTSYPRDAGQMGEKDDHRRSQDGREGSSRQERPLMLEQGGSKNRGNNIDNVNTGRNQPTTRGRETRLKQTQNYEEEQLDPSNRRRRL
ncbi:hypothetical protein M5689_007203 [Euphorbia peplus]|nr:hypothetical protein M5689_007203 [Euphorbia peplus]